MPGQFMWFDLNAADAGQAREFYGAMFGWAVAPAGDAGPYQAWITDGQQPWAGITHAAAADRAGWLPYVLVEDLDEAAKRAVSLGATVIAGPADGPAGTAVTIADPGGGTPRAVQTAPRPGLIPRPGGREPSRTRPGRRRACL